MKLHGLACRLVKRSIKQGFSAIPARIPSAAARRLRRENAREYIQYSLRFSLSSQRTSLDGLHTEWRFDPESSKSVIAI